MINQIADHSFEPFGTFYDEPIDIQNHSLICQEITSHSKDRTTFYLPLRDLYRMYTRTLPAFDR